MISQLVNVGRFVENLRPGERPANAELLFITSFITEAFRIIVPGVTQHPVMLPLNAHGLVSLITCVGQFAVAFADIMMFSMTE